MNVQGFKKAFDSLNEEEQKNVVSQLSDEELQAITNFKPTGLLERAAGFVENLPSALPGAGKMAATTLRAIPNIPESGMNFASGIAQSIGHPLDTVSGMQKLISGAAQKIPGVSEGLDYAREQLPSSMQLGTREDIQAADAYGQYQKNRYGGLSNIENTMVTDPVGFLADASTVAGGAGLGLKAAGLGKAASTAQAISTGTNPVFLAGKAISPITKPIGILAREISSPVGRTIRDVYRSASKEGPRTIANENIQKVAGVGGEAELLKIKQALSKTESLVPGSQLTSADAIGGANVASGRFGSPLVRLQEEISKLPEGTSLLKSTEVAQESARQASLAKISNVANRPAAEALVAKAQEAYKAINPTMVRSNSTLKNIANSKAFRAAEKRPAEISQDTNAVARANKERVIPFKKTVNIIDKNGKQVKATEYSAQGLQNIKQVLDEMSENPTLRTQLGISGTESVAIGSVRSSLVNWRSEEHT